MKELILGIWLGIEGIIDFKYKEIPQWLCILGGVIGVGFCIVEKRALNEVIISCVPGMLALIFSKVTKEMMGYGDGIILLVLGTYLPLKQIVSMGITAFSIAGIVALGLLIFFQKRGSYRIPFIPFLSLAYGIEYVIRWGGNSA